MQKPPHVPHSYDGIFHSATSLVERLAQAVACCSVTPDLFREVEEALSCLPISTAEFALAKCRLGNVARYCNGGEYGAARYELRLMLNSFSQ